MAEFEKNGTINIQGLFPQWNVKIASKHGGAEKTTWDRIRAEFDMYD